MTTAKDVVCEVVQSQPDDASYEEIMKALALERMVQRGLDDVRANRVISNEDMAAKIDSWRQ